MSISLVTPPSAEPVSVAQLMQQMGMVAVADGGLDETLQFQFSSALISARREIESYLRRVLITQHWILRLDHFRWHEMDLPKPPFQSIDWFKYVDTGANVDQLYRDTTYGQNFPAPYGYQLERGSETECARIFPPWAKPWPPVLLVPSAVMIQFRCGYGGPQNVSMTQGSGVLVGPVFNPDDAPIMTGEIGTRVVIPGAGTNGLSDPPVVGYVASVDQNGQATLNVTAATAVTNVAAWIGNEIPPEINKAILLTAQYYYEQTSVGGDLPEYIKCMVKPYRNLVA